MGDEGGSRLSPLLNGLNHSLVLESDSEGMQLLVPNQDLHRPKVRVPGFVCPKKKTATLRRGTKMFEDRRPMASAVSTSKLQMRCACETLFARARGYSLDSCSRCRELVSASLRVATCTKDAVANASGSRTARTSTDGQEMATKGDCGG